MFRFTIRELVLLTLVVAMGVAWWIDRTRQVRRYDRLHYALEQSTGTGQIITFDSSGELYPSYPDSPRQ